MKDKPEGASQPEPQQEVTRKLGLNRCPFCHDDVSVEQNDWVACRDCLARHHSACWEEGAACGSCGSTTALETRPEKVTAPLTRKRRDRTETKADQALASLGSSMKSQKSGMPMFLGMVGVLVLFALLLLPSESSRTESSGWPYEGSPTMTPEQYSAMTQKNALIAQLGKRLKRCARRP